MKPQYVKTPQEVREDWNRKGVSLRSWAGKYGFPISTVSQVLHGKNSGRIGVGHRIAVALGIKQGEVVNE